MEKNLPTTIAEKVNPSLTYQYTYEKKLFAQKGPFQEVEVVETKELGRVLFNDKIAMLSDKDEFIYHEMISR